MHFYLQRVWEASDWQNSAWISFLAKSQENIWYSQQAETFQCLRPPVPFLSPAVWLSLAVHWDSSNIYNSCSSRQPGTFTNEKTSYSWQCWHWGTHTWQTCMSHWEDQFSICLSPCLTFPNPSLSTHVNQTAYLQKVWSMLRVVDRDISFITYAFLSPQKHWNFNLIHWDNINIF